jgi:hypothetical protein
MMDVVVGCVVIRNELQWIPWEMIPAVVVDCLDRGEAKEEKALARSHPSDFEGKTSSESIKQETFKGMIVQGSVCVGNIESVMSRMECSWHGVS